MAKEIERKFLVSSPAWRAEVVASLPIRQAYIYSDPEATVRVRVKGVKAFLTVKGLTRECERDEWEYEIPVSDADDMAERLAGGWAISKTRHIVPAPDGLVWEIDEFHGRHAPLVIAEIELPSSGFPLPQLPAWIGKEVTSDPAYFNSALASR